MPLSFVMIFDRFSSLFIRFIRLISGVVFLYSSIYMYRDNTPKRFIILVNLFVLSIYLLVISPSLLRIIVGWDGLGVISFLLVMYYQNSSSLKSSLITIYTNRFGDVAILFSLYYLYSLRYWAIENFYWNSFSFFLACFLIIAAITKRAQIPFSSWLPAAIAAPTPVSSLVHSSTLVTAGVYLIIRFFYLISWFIISFIFSLIALLTSLWAGFIAYTEPDLKKVVAISTLRQLGLIMYVISLGEIKLCFFHIVCHALFKSLLFLSCGIIILLRYGNQDSRIIGSFSIITPNIFLMFIISRISLFGFPFTSGFFSKDFILELLLVKSNFFFSSIILFLCCILTVMYRMRLFFFGLSSYRLREKFYSFKESFLILRGIIVLTFWAISLGKISFFYLFSSFICSNSFIDKIIGILIISIGFMLNSMLKNKISLRVNNIMEILGEIIFLNWIFRGFFSIKIKYINKLYGGDLLWIELIGPKIFNNFLLNIRVVRRFNKILSVKISIMFFLLLILFKWFF